MEYSLLFFSYFFLLQFNWSHVCANSDRNHVAFVAKRSIDLKIVTHMRRTRFNDILRWSMTSLGRSCVNGCQHRRLRHHHPIRTHIYSHVRWKRRCTDEAMKTRQSIRLHHCVIIWTQMRPWWQWPNFQRYTKAKNLWMHDLMDRHIGEHILSNFWNARDNTHGWI